MQTDTPHFGVRTITPPDAIYFDMNIPYLSYFFHVKYINKLLVSLKELSILFLAYNKLDWEFN